MKQRKNICSELEWNRCYDKHIYNLVQQKSTIKRVPMFKLNKKSHEEYRKGQQRVEIFKNNTILTKKIAKVNSSLNKIFDPKVFYTLNVTSLNHSVNKKFEENTYMNNICMFNKIKNAQVNYNTNKLREDYVNHCKRLKSISQDKRKVLLNNRGEKGCEIGYILSK